MRRALLALTGLAAGTTLLISLKSAPGAGRLPGQLAADVAADPRATGSPTAPAPGGTPVPKKPKTTTAAARPPQGGTAVGSLVQTPYGDVRVSIKVSGGRLVDVTAVELPSGGARSEQLSRRAGPQLRESALAAQSADIDTVSGATFTSEAYAESLQSALDKAGLG